MALTCFPQWFAFALRWRLTLFSSTLCKISPVHPSDIQAFTYFLFRRSLTPAQKKLIEDFAAQESGDAAKPGQGVIQDTIERIKKYMSGK